MEEKSFSASINMPEKSLRDLFKALLPKTKPENLKYPNKKRKWRIRKKWFNQYEKQTWIGREMEATDKNGNNIYMEITSAKLSNRGVSFEAKPIARPKHLIWTNK